MMVGGILFFPMWEMFIWFPITLSFHVPSVFLTKMILTEEELLKL